MYSVACSRKSDRIIGLGQNAACVLPYIYRLAEVSWKMGSPASAEACEGSDDMSAQIKPPRCFCIPTFIFSYCSCRLAFPRTSSTCRCRCDRSEEGLSKRQHSARKASETILLYISVQLWLICPPLAPAKVTVFRPSKPSISIAGYATRDSRSL